MMQWIQESGPIFQEFARQSNIQVPNYTPNMSRPANTGQGEEVHNIEEDDEDDESKEMDFEEDD
ncbi:hypothetical protein Goklo_004281, partial [Gossypium klotzschianum]|nr:hypothetical protein [Gossypium klotzschianum]